MLALQLGLRYSVGRVSTQPIRRDMSPIEFQLKVRVKWSGIRDRCV